MNYPVQGLHHVTATVNDAQEDFDFYTKILGLRLVKKTVNFDNTGVYHFYYGNETGTPGTIMTTFPYKGMGIRDGVKGNGQVVFTTFSVPMGSIAKWTTRLEKHGIGFTEFERFDASGLRFEDPSSLGIELLEAEDGRAYWVGGSVSDSDMAIRGIHSVSMQLGEVGPTIDLMTQHLNYKLVGQKGNRYRLEAGEGGSGKIIDLLHESAAERGKNGIGTVHHVAMAIGNDDELIALRAFILQRGMKITEVKDRKYFHSIYFREPGGVLFEVATIPPGFTVDEEKNKLGGELKLPDWGEEKRGDIEAILPKITA